jgi:hypothetical protein
MPRRNHTSLSFTQNITGDLLVRRPKIVGPTNATFDLTPEYSDREVSFPGPFTPSIH